MSARRQSLIASLFEHGLGNGGCVTVISGVPLDGVTHAFQTASQPLSDPADASGETVSFYALGDDGFLVIEDWSGFRGNGARVLRGASRGGGRVGSLHWTEDQNTSLALAENEEIRYRAGELLAPGTPIGVPDALSRCFDDLQFGDAWFEEALVAIERFTATRIPTRLGELQRLGVFELSHTTND